MQIQNCVSISQVVLGVVVGGVIPKMGNCDFGAESRLRCDVKARTLHKPESAALANFIQPRKNPFFMFRFTFA
jgi:hypothetical protein